MGNHHSPAGHLGQAPRLGVMRPTPPPRVVEIRAGDNASKMLSAAPGTVRAPTDRKLLSLLAVVVWSWQQRRPAPREEAPPTGTGLRPQVSGPFPPASANTETSNDQDPGPAAFPALLAQGGKKTRKQADSHQESVPLKGSSGEAGVGCKGNGHGKHIL